MGFSAPSFVDALREGGVVFDGAMGTALLAAGVPFDRGLEYACVKHPGAVRAVHGDHVAAGAQVVVTNTIGAIRARLAGHDAGALRERVLAAVELARSAAPRFVVGSLGPSGIASSAVASSQSRLLEVFEEAASALAEAGADALLLETFCSLPEVELALQAVRRVRDRAGRELAVVASVSLDAGGRVGDIDVRTVARRLADAGADAVGLNCSQGPPSALLAPSMLECGLPVVARPSAGVPSAGTTLASPFEFACLARTLFDAGVHAVGGCCGTSSEHVATIASAVRSTPRFAPSATRNQVHR